MHQPEHSTGTVAPRLPAAARALAARIRQAATPRRALLLSLVIAWLNLLLTSRWAHVPGTLHGWRLPYFATALVVTSVLALLVQVSSRPLGRLVPRLFLAGALLVLTSAFLCWFPPSAWSMIPFTDNWPPRFQSTIEGVGLLRQGAFSGWQWSFLGGYHAVSDITQNLAVLGFVPIVLLGPTVGFHLLHAVLFASIPLLVFLDLKDEDREVALFAAGISALLVGNFSFMLVRSGDTNSVAGAACAALALYGSHAARRGRTFGLPVLVLGLTLTVCSHMGFLSYVAAYLTIEALYFRDWRSGVSAAIAMAIALVASLPLTWELWRYPEYFKWNNVAIGAPAGFDYGGFARGVYYNVELLLRPGRWTNDYTGFTAVFLPIVAIVAAGRRSRIGFHALAALFTVLMVRFNTPQFGYLFARPIHMYTFFTAAPVAYFVVRQVGHRGLAAMLAVLIGLYVQITFQTVPHVADARAFDPPLVARMAAADGPMVLVENNPHRNMNLEGGQTEPSAFNVHFESLLPAVTGKRFYAGYWDGWQWSPWRTLTVAGGTFRGRPLAMTTPEQFSREMRAWGVARLFVWSTGAHAYLDAHPRFASRWSSGRWTEYEFLDADPRSATIEASTTAGAANTRPRATLTGTGPLGGRVELADVRAGDLVVVRTHYYPAWTAVTGDRRETVALTQVHDGQMAFHAPRSGSYSVSLVYPRRRGLVAGSLIATMLAAAWLTAAARRS